METNGPLLEMYKMKPFYGSNVIVSIPDNMYKMKNFQEDQQNAKKLMDITVDGDPVAVLEQKQDAILKRLGELRSMVEQLNTKYSVHPSFSQKSSASKSVPSEVITTNGVIHDMVVNVDPTNPPSQLLLTLYEMLKKSYKVLATTFVHSSVTNISDDLRNLLNGQSDSYQRDIYQIALTLVWKKLDSGPTLMVSPHNQTTIHGEVNIARYVMRLLAPAYGTADPLTATQIDDWLDLAHLQILHGNSKEKSAALRSLNSRLGRNTWLAGSSMTMADLVVFSALNQCGLVTDTPANVKKWIKLCDNSPSETAAKICS